MIYVTIYYNDVRGNIIPPNCPNVRVELSQAKQFAENKMESGEWYNYLIPELADHEVIFQDQMHNNENED